MSAVEWKAVPIASGHEVSSDGRIRSIDRFIDYKDGRGRLAKGKEMKLSTDPGSKGYPRTTIRTDARGRVTFGIHQLVCLTFHGPAPTPRHEVRHLNGDQLDNRAENLAWGTRAENMQDVITHGRNAAMRKTQCPQGHPYSSSNTRIKNGRWRICRICSREQDKLAARRSRARKREARLAGVA